MNIFNKVSLFRFRVTHLRTLLKSKLTHLEISERKPNDGMYEISSTRIQTLNQRCPVISSVTKGREADSQSPELLDTSFNNPENAFKSKTTWELIRAYIVYQMCSIPPLVENNMKIMKFCNNVLGDKLFVMLMKLTFYGHFVAEEDEEKIKPIVMRMHSFGVRSILDYSVEEDIPHEKAETLEKAALGNAKTELPEYQVDVKLLDRREHVVSARTFFYESEKACDKNMDIILKCIEAVPSATNGSGMTAVKLTALGRPQLLLQVSEVIAKTRKYLSEIDERDHSEVPVIKHHLKATDIKEKLCKAGNDSVACVDEFLNAITADNEGVIHLFPWSGIISDEFEINETFQVPDLKTGEMVRFMSHLTKEEETMFKNMVRRFNTVVKAAFNADVKLMVDAEQTYFQPAISRLTVEMMRKYNVGRGIVYNTYQGYLKSCYDEVISDMEQARRQNFYFRCKLVRGAYIDQERERAKDMNYPDPTNPTYEATSEMYHKTLAECLRRIRELKESGDLERKIEIVVASHNEDTVRYAVEKMKEIGIEPHEGTIAFGQLLGMCDFITFPLGQAGYPVYKYVPYGPVKEVLPYLSRRASENKGMLKNVRKEKQMLSKEILRRLMAMDLNQNPKGKYAPT